MPTHTPAKKRAAKKKKTKSMLRKALDLAISKGKKSSKGRSGNVNQNKQLKDLEK